MKTPLVFLSLLFLLFAVASPAPAYEMAIGLSPYQDPRQAETQVKQVLQFLTDTIQPGQSALLFDAYHLRTLGVFAVPPNPSYRHPKAKVQANAKTMASLFAFAKQASLPPGTQEPAMPNALRWPQALRFIGQNYPPNGQAHLIMLGSPLFDDPAEQGFSMRHGRIPGDGHLASDRARSPYGTKGQETLLTQWRVHLGFPGVSWKQTDHHAFYVQRFWTLHVERQGGQLATFTNDMPTLFERVRTNAAAQTNQYKAELSDKVEMIQLRPPTVKQTSIYERPLSSVPLTAHALQRASNVEVGITWECSGCDLDLYGQNALGSAPLWFLCPQTKDGQYFKDFRNSPRSANGYETLAYNVPIDLNALLLAVNFYHGNAPGGVKGEVRISFNGQTYAKAFHISAPDGNGGVGRQETLTARRANNPAWLVIDPMEVLGVRSSATVVSQR
jgi:hypothetical protein